MRCTAETLIRLQCDIVADEEPAPAALRQAMVDELSDTEHTLYTLMGTIRIGDAVRRLGWHRASIESAFRRLHAYGLADRERRAGDQAYWYYKTEWGRDGS